MKPEPAKGYGNALFDRNNPEFKSIEDKVIEKIKQRQAIGLKKYGVSVKDNPLTELEWLNHLQEELLDGAIYVEKLKERLTISIEDKLTADEFIDKWVACVYTPIHFGKNARRIFTSNLNSVIETEVNEAVEGAQHPLKELLCIIHRDGGHYITEHGLEKACEDAKKVVVDFIQSIKE